MSDLRSLVRALRDNGIRLFVTGQGGLRYEAPAGALSDSLRDAIRDNKAELIELLGEARGPGRHAALPRVGADRYELSWQQEQIWVNYRLTPTPALHLPAVIRLRGELDTDRLAAAIETLVRGTDVLHSRLVEVEGRWWQRLVPDGAFEVVRQTVPAASLDTEVTRIEDVLNSRPFDLQAEFALRAAIVSAADARTHHLVFVAHHIAVDAISVALLFQQVFELYGGNTAGGAVAARYGDFVQWQRSPEQRTAMTASAETYAAMLRGAPVLHGFPLDRPRGRHHLGHGARVEKTLPASLVDRFETVCRNAGASLFMGLEAVLAVLMYRFSGESDVVLGSPMANRQHPDTQQMVGCFVNMLPLRVRIEAGDSFGRLLRRIREFNALAYEHQHVPINLLLERLGISRSSAHAPLFQVTVGLQPRRLELDLPQLECDPLPVDSTTSAYDLGLDVSTTRNGYRARWQYDSHLFDAETVERLSEHFVACLEQAAAAPDTAVDGLLPQEKQSDRDDDIVPTTALHIRFSEIADRHPDTPALILDDVQYTYDDLRKRAEALAAVLVSHGAGPGRFVGIPTARRVETYVALLAVVMSGAAYLPLDADNPTSRLQAMIGQSQAGIVVADEPLSAALPAAMVGVTVLDANVSARDAASPLPVHRVPTESWPLYAMFTSGSSGQPKGVMATHEGVSRLAANTPWLTMPPAARCLQAATLAFDASTFELWVCWLQGATVVVAGKSVVLDAQALGQLVQRFDIDRAFLTTALFNRIVASGHDVLRRLQLVLFGGEAVSNPSVEAACRACPDTQFVHVYGPTENTTFSTGHVVAERDFRSGRPIPIGRALRGDRACVLSAAMTPVPAGGVGELFVAGPGLAQGYLRGPRETAAVFVPDPHAVTGGARMYRTGDVVRWLDNGEFEFMQRRDRQVKIRGYRLELAGIEVSIGDLPPVSECAVGVEAADGADRQLVAYIVAAGGHTDAVSEIRDAIKARLPAYMRPHRIHLVASLPLNSNGKIDWDRLAELEAEDESPADAPALSGSEHKVATVWREVLGVASLSADSDFFSIGGDSLQAMDVCHRLESQYGATIPLQAFFLEPTLGNVASLLEQDLTPDDTGMGLQEISL